MVRNVNRPPVIGAIVPRRNPSSDSSSLCGKPSSPWRRTQVVAVQVHPSPIRPHYLKRDRLEGIGSSGLPGGFRVVRRRTMASPPGSAPIVDQRPLWNPSQGLWIAPMLNAAYHMAHFGLHIQGSDPHGRGEHSLETRRAIRQAAGGLCGVHSGGAASGPAARPPRPAD